MLFHSDNNHPAIIEAIDSTSRYLDYLQNIHNAY